MFCMRSSEAFVRTRDECAFILTGLESPANNGSLIPAVLSGVGKTGRDRRNSVKSAG